MKGHLVYIAFLAWALLPAACSPPTATAEFEGDAPGECGDDADNDRDGRFDCDDPGCIGSAACGDGGGLPETDALARMPDGQVRDARNDASPGVRDAAFLDAGADASPPGRLDGGANCYLTDCLDDDSESPPVLGDPHGDNVGAGEDPPCLLSPTGAYPPNRSQDWHYDAYDVVGDNIVAMADGFVRDGHENFGSWGCYSSGQCFGSVNCPCVEQADGTHAATCSEDNPAYSGGSFDYREGLLCYNELCHPGRRCDGPGDPCHNQVSIEFLGLDGQTSYIQRALHIDELRVEPGEVVTAGQVVATIGATGFVCTSRREGTGAHAHVSVYKRVDGEWVAQRWWDWMRASCDEQPAVPAHPRLDSPADGAAFELSSDVTFRFTRAGNAPHRFTLRQSPPDGPVLRDEAVAGNEVTVEDMAAGTYRWTVYFENPACQGGRCAALARLFTVREGQCQDPTFDRYCLGDALRERNACGTDREVSACPHGCDPGRSACRPARAQCDNGERRRCWVECAQEFGPGCIHAGSFVRLMGIETCDGGAWGECSTLR